MSKTLLLVDDHPLFRRGVKELILRESNVYKSVFEADNGRDALNQIDRHQPDCIMLDIAMPGIDGLRTLELIRDKNSAALCVILSMYDNPEFVNKAQKLGASGYILKTDPEAVILECLYSVEHGRTYVSASLASSLEANLPEIEVTLQDLDKLSPREKQVLAMIASNQTSREIAQSLQLSLRTIQNHRVNICKKLGLSGPNALLKVAIENQSLL